MKFSFCAILLAFAVLASAQDAKDDYDDFAALDYDEFYDEDQLKEEGDRIEAELDKLDSENDLKVKEEIEKLKEDTAYVNDKNNGILDDAIDDYQFEDNRDKPKEDKDNVPPIDNDEDKRKREQQADYALLWGDDSVAPLPVPEAESSDNQAILEETQKLLDREADDFEEEIKKEIQNSLNIPVNKPDDDIIHETRRLLKETDDSFDDVEAKADDKPIDVIKIEAAKNVTSDNANDQVKDKSVDTEESKPEIIDDVPNEKAVEDVPINHLVEKIGEKDQDGDVKEDDNSNVVHDVFPEEDTVDKVYADLHEDLNKLMDTLDKLSDDGDVSDEKLDEIYDKLDEHLFKEDGDNVEGSEELTNDNDSAEYSEVDFDKLVADILQEDDIKPDEPKDDAADIDLKVLLNDVLNEPNPDDTFEKDVEPLPEVNAEPILPSLDAKVNKTKNAESIETNDNEPEINASVEAKDAAAKPNKHSVDIDTLNSGELEDLVEQFSIVNSDALDPHSKTFLKDNAPIHIKLNIDEPVEVTSPNYPRPYTTNNVVDWIFEGDGVGIEMNITDFNVNGALGDYLLVKPGGVDDSGHDGLVFTYRLKSEKRFLFSDVDRMFVRFLSRPGSMNNMRGFHFTVKMVSPVPEEPESMPEPEAVLNPPHSVHTIYLASAIPQFNDLKEQFRLLLADMAEEYIVDNDVNRGLNTTQEVTQITAVSVCPVTWPRYELCTAVTYGVSLVEGDEDMLDKEALRDMWSTYSVRDPHALKLEQMGLADFQQPSTSVLTAWLVIASGVVISMMMLALVLWRFSCFEDYTRMKTYSDTESIQNDKRGLDLFPTPHQSLPPLYAENEYKWGDNDDSSRVDMGGFANQSYARNMYDFDSDEEVVPQRDRTGAVTARDIYGGSVA